MSSRITTTKTITKRPAKRTAQKPRKAPRKQTRPKSRRSVGGPKRLARKPALMGQLVRSIRDPFHYAPPLVGCGTNIPLTQASLFSRNTITVPSANSILIVCKGANNDMVETFTQASPSGAWSAGTGVSYNSANSASISARFQTGRAISGGLKLRCLVAATAAPPLIMGGLIYDTRTNLIALTPNSTTSEQQLQAGYSLSNAMEVTYRTSDVVDYTLTAAVTNSSSGFSTSALVPMLVIFISNATGATMTILLDALFHIEGNSGVDIGGDDTDDSMAAAGFSLDEVTRAGNNAGPISTDRVSAAGIMDTLVSSMAAGPRGTSLRAEGGLVQPSVPFLAVSTSAPPVPSSPYVSVEEKTPEEANNIVLSRSLYNVLTRK